MSYNCLRDYLVKSRDYFTLTSIQKQQKENSIKGQTFLVIGTVSDVTENTITLYDKSLPTSSDLPEIRLRIDYSGEIFSAPGTAPKIRMYFDNNPKLKDTLITKKDIHDLKQNQKVAVSIKAERFSCLYSHCFQIEGKLELLFIVVN